MEHTEKPTPKPVAQRLKDAARKRAKKRERNRALCEEFQTLRSKGELSADIYAKISRKYGIKSPSSMYYILNKEKARQQSTEQTTEQYENTAS